jgi:hypothetical protein
MMEHGLEDLFAAYRRAPTSQPQFTLVALWRPDRFALQMEGWLNAWREGGWVPQW